MPAKRLSLILIVMGSLVATFGSVSMIVAVAPSSASDVAIGTAGGRTHQSTTTTSSTTIPTTTSTSTTVPASGPILNGVGTSVIDPAMGGWAAALGHASVPEQISYTGGGDSDAEPSFAANNFSVDGGPDFLANESSLLPQTQKQLAAAGQQVAFAPVSATGLSFVFALRLEKCVDGQPSDEPGPQVTSLTLTPDLLAGMFLGQTILNDGTVADWKYAVPNWNEQAILSLNPGLGTTCSAGVADVLAGGTEDEAVFPIGRQDAAPENQALASFFAEAAPTIWNLYLGFTKNPGYRPTDQFPWDASNLTSNGYLAANESAELTDLVGGNNAAFPTPYFQTVSYLTTSDLAREQAQFSGAGLTPAVVDLVPNSVTSLPATGVEPLEPTTAAVGAALAGLKTNPDGTFQPDYDFSNTTAWPIPMLTYLVVPTNHLAKDSAGPLAELINFAVSATGQADLVPFGWPATEGRTYGYTPLTGSLQAYASAASGVAAEVAKEGSTPVTPDVTTTTTTAPNAASRTTTATTTMTASSSGQQSLAGLPATGVGSTGGPSTGPADSPSESLGERSGGTRASGRAAETAGGSGQAPTGAAAAARFIVEGDAVTDHPGSSVLTESFGAAAPWLVILGGGAIGLGLLLRRRDRLDVGVP